MFNHIIFVTYLVVFLISTIGHGYLFASIFYKDFKYLNFGYLGIIGFFAISLISTFSTFFTPHDYLHNTILHLVGLSAFFYKFFF